jgi:hypothetical protein
MKFAVVAAFGLLASIARPAVADDINLGGLADIDLNAFGDYRLVAPAGERSWNDGGLGKTRFGGGGGLEGRYGVAGVVGSALLTPDLRIVGDLQFLSAGQDSLDLVEAYLRYRPVSTSRLRYSIKAGAFFPPVSLENTGVGWTSPWTLTPSAINSWVGEELRTFGAEGNLEWRGDEDTITLGAALFADNEPAGALLAARGWAFDDQVNGIGSEVRLPDILAQASADPAPYRYNAFQQIDDRVGYYADAAWQSPEWGRVTLMHYDNDANPAAGAPDDVYAWHTQFWSLGAATRVGPVELLSQAMTGRTQVTPSPQYNTVTDYQAGYLLAAMTFGQWQPTVRFDVFGTQRASESPYGSSEHGNAMTFALNWRPREWLRFTGEVVRIDSWRTQRLAEGLQPRQIDNQLQLAARVFY